MTADGLYERAASHAEAPRSLWYVGQGLSAFAGPLQRNVAHRHSVPVLLCGLYDAFKLQIADEPWLQCRLAVVPAGVTYAFDMAGDPLAVVYLEPSVADAAALAPLVGEGREVGGALVGRASETYGLRALFEDQDSASWAGEALADLLRFSSARARRALDPRIAHVVTQLQLNEGDQVAVANAAASVGLSASRFQHLFAADVGVPYRRYRAWQRMLAAIREIVAGANFTAAAHAAGYADQAHFAHDFRRMFGASASPSMVNVRG
jgi:AraC-like DNA-binding protein